MYFQKSVIDRKHRGRKSIATMLKNEKLKKTTNAKCMNSQFASYYSNCSI